MRRLMLILLLIVPSVVAMAAFGYFALQDWAALQPAYEEFREARAGGADARDLFIAWGTQDIHRVNLAADGAWFLLAAIVFAIGVHGLCTQPAPPSRIPEALVEEQMLREAEERLAETTSWRRLEDGMTHQQR